MKKIYVLAGLAAAAVAPMVAHASDGTISFTGALITTTCAVDPAAGNINQTVTLPTLATGTLAAAGATAGDTAFQIKTGGSSCAFTSATTYFESNANVDSVTGRLKPTGPGAATNVQLQLLNKSGTPIDLSKGAGAQNVAAATITGGTSTSEFKVRYYATGVTTAGTVNSNITFSMIYN